MAQSLVDVLILGGGPGGLATATGLARQLHTAVVFDNKVYRNARADHMHNVPGWDHQPPSALRDKARSDLVSRYNTIQFQDVAISQVRKNGTTGHYEAVDQAGVVWAGRKLVLANGAAEVHADIEGYAECWGYSIFGCLFCHGYEERGLPSSGVLASAHSGDPAVALHLARMARRLTDKVIIYTNGAEDAAATITDLLANDKGGRAGKITVDNRRLVRLQRGSAHPSEIVIGFKDGSAETHGFLVHQPHMTIAGPFAKQLELELTPTGDIKSAPPFYETSMPGVFAVGDCATPLKAVSQALAMGAFAAAGIVFQLGAELSKIE